MAAAILRSVGFVVLFVLAVWFLGQLLGFEIGLVGTLVASVGLTLVANLLFGGFQKLRS